MSRAGGLVRGRAYRILIFSFFALFFVPAVLQQIICPAGGGEGGGAFLFLVYMVGLMSLYGFFFVCIGL